MITYATAAAFKQALEARLRSSSTTGVDFARRRQLLVFDRFLAGMHHALRAMRRSQPTTAWKWASIDVAGSQGDGALFRGSWGRRRSEAPYPRLLLIDVCVHPPRSRSAMVVRRVLRRIMGPPGGPPGGKMAITSKHTTKPVTKTTPTDAAASKQGAEKSITNGEAQPATHAGPETKRQTCSERSPSATRRACELSRRLSASGVSWRPMRIGSRSSQRKSVDGRTRPRLATPPPR